MPPRPAAASAIASRHEVSSVTSHPTAGEQRHLAAALAQADADAAPEPAGGTYNHGSHVWIPLVRCDRDVRPHAASSKMEGAGTPRDSEAEEAALDDVGGRVDRGGRPLPGPEGAEQRHPHDGLGVDVPEAPRSQESGHAAPAPVERS